MKTKTFTIFFFLLFFQNLFAQKNELITSIPFELKEDGRIYIKAKINKSDTLTFLFDSGAKSVVIVDSIARNSLKLKFDGKDINIGSYGESTVESSSKNTLIFGNQKIDNLTLYSIPYSTKKKFDGIIGCEIIKKYVVEVNYDSKMILFYNKENYNYNGNGEKLNVKFIDDIPTVGFTFKLRKYYHKGQMSWDTGSNGDINFTTQFTENNKLYYDMPILGESESISSDGNMSKELIGLINQVNLGDYEFYKIPCTLTTNESNVNDSKKVDGAFGNRFLKRFNAVYVLGNNIIYITPNHYLHSPYYDFLMGK
ncbi:retropepsin-like domain-containing protein [Polaribacter batillariae]|uniref:Retropepsin-like domain-containing protein n=1 Tax=Polaribacter batillariae TaxID=2808900 RepID=A0ABX7T2N3_9FLAO|nr:retropepsin-like aspartic protease [Polaribacter batillariae]QTD39209.1 retropepsin-like domain-containing protein [Polaribacter batillariae]